MWWPEREPSSELRRAESKEVYELRKKIEDVARRHREWEMSRRMGYFDRIEKNFKLRAEHVTLLKKCRWELTEGTDWSSIAASGKYPFGGGDWVDDVFDILGWVKEYDAEGLTDACRERAADIMAELPHALKVILKDIDTELFVLAHSHG